MEAVETKNRTSLNQSTTIENTTTNSLNTNIMKKKLLILTIVFFAIQAGYCQTYVSGGIYSNTTWTEDGNPYIVTGDVVVFSDVELTIEPGVLVKFDAGTGIEFRGDLRAIGTIQDTIVFTSNFKIRQHLKAITQHRAIKLGKIYDHVLCE